ncbi:MAG: hypothetical protein J0H17_18745 [Rhizobiales bacterium]|nr:hypothetical protein [Hyphomicrobiales bacterium]
MASKAVVDAVEARLAANWSTCPIFGINDEATPPADGSPFLIVQYPIASARGITVGAPGANVHREEGTFRIVIHTERGGGTAKGLQWGDEIAAIFRTKAFDGVRTFSPSPPIEDDTNESGVYYAHSISVPYQFDLIG